MAYPRGALPVFFGRGQQNDAQRLHDWKAAPLTCPPDPEMDEQWNVDRYEVILGHNASGDTFRRAARLVMRNQFYPPEVMTSVSDFLQEDRDVQEGDRVLQRIRIFQYNTLPILEVLTMNEITSVIAEPRRAGFTYTTTAAHSEIGEWSPLVEWRENGEVALVITVASRMRPGASDLLRRFSRRLQLRAHQLSIQNFQARLAGRRFRATPVQPAFAGIIPAAVVILFIAIVMAGLFRAMQKKER